ncbi:MAG: hypothetical protein U0768_02670 [Anaerolineae bacterium]
MSKLLRPQDAIEALVRLQRGHMRRMEMPSEQLSAQEVFLRDWQVKRLSTTHGDLLASPEYGPAAEFFLSELYGPRDFSRRDADLLALFDFLRSFVPENAIRAMAYAVEVNELTHQLDGKLLHDLRALGVTGPFTEAEYDEAYRQGDYDARVHQIDLIVDTGKELAKLRGAPLVGVTLRAARGPAYRLGWGELQEFLEAGYKAWANMKDPEFFLNTIGSREMAILNRIFRRN